VLEYQGKKGQTITKKGCNNLYVKNFSKDPTFTEDSLADLFSEFGDVQNACIMRDANGESKGFGFVCFRDSSSAEKATKAVAECNPQNLDGDEIEDKNDSKDLSKFSKLYVREAKKKGQRYQELTMNNFKYKKSIMFFSLFVKNFPPGTTDDELKIYFSSACQGEVTKV